MGHKKILTPLAIYRCKMAFFLEGVTHSKSGVTRLSLVALITQKLDLSNEVHKVSELPLVFLEPVGVQRHTEPHFKGLIKLHLEAPSSRAWRYFFFAPCPLEGKPFYTYKCPKVPILSIRIVIDCVLCAHIC